MMNKQQTEFTRVHAGRLLGLLLARGGVSFKVIFLFFAFRLGGPEF